KMKLEISEYMIYFFMFGDGLITFLHSIYNVNTYINVDNFYDVFFIKENLHYGIYYNSINNFFAYNFISPFYIYGTDEYLDVMYSNRFVLLTKLGHLYFFHARNKME